MPTGLQRYLKPKWHLLRDYTAFRASHGGRVYRNKEIGEWVAVRRFDGRDLSVPVRSYRQFRRYHQFGGHNERDVLWLWMNQLSDCEVIYDVGSSNGLEGFLINHLWGSKVIFVEPFTPSVETLLKTIVLVDPERRGDFEVVQAACDREVGYRKLFMHHGPIPGANRNSFATPEDYDRGGRQDQESLCDQWVMAVSLDSLHWQFGLPLPTHVKIDVDGFENRVMEGAARLLNERIVRSWGIELNGQENLRDIRALMSEHGYVETGSWEHYPGNQYYSGDSIFVRDDLIDT